MPTRRVLRPAFVWIALVLQTSLVTTAHAVGPACGWPFHQPVVPLADIGAVVIGEVQAANDRFQVRVGWPNFDPSTLATWTVGDFTGFFASSASQRSHKNEYPDSAVQISHTDATIGMWLNSLEEEPSFSSAGRFDVSINAGCWYWSSPQQVFPSNDQGVKISFDIQVPYANTVGGAAAMAGLNLMFQEYSGTIPTGKAFWMSALVFDKRPAISTWHAVQPDTSGTTTAAIVGSSIDVPGWFHKGPNSQGFRSSQYSGYAHYEVRISPKEFEQAVKSLIAENSTYSGASTNASSWRLLHFNIGAEFHDTGFGDWGQIGISVKNIAAEEYYPSHFVYMGGANTAATNTMRVYFITEADLVWDEVKAVNVTFPNGGGWNALTANMSSNPKWYGVIRGVRFFPFNTSATGVGMDYVRIGDVNHKYLQSFDFNEGANSLSGWTLYNIGSLWFEPTRWGGLSTSPIPIFEKLIPGLAN